MTVSDLCGLIQEEMNKMIKSQIEEHLAWMEDSIKVMSELGNTLASNIIIIIKLLPEPVLTGVFKIY